MVLLGFLLIAGLAVLLWYLSRGTYPEDIFRGSYKKEDLLEIAKRHYARGEITKDEFEEIKRRLRRGHRAL